MSDCNLLFNGIDNLKFCYNTEKCIWKTKDNLCNKNNLEVNLSKDFNEKYDLLKLNSVDLNNRIYSKDIKLDNLDNMGEFCDKLSISFGESLDENYRIKGVGVSGDYIYIDKKELKQEIIWNDIIDKKPEDNEIVIIAVRNEDEPCVYFAQFRKPKNCFVGVFGGRYSCLNEKIYWASKPEFNFF